MITQPSLTVSSTHVLGPEPDAGEEALPAAAVEGGLPGPELLVGRGRLAHEGAGRVVAEELDPVERRVVPEVSLIGLDLELEALGPGVVRAEGLRPPLSPVAIGHRLYLHLEWTKEDKTPSDISALSCECYHVRSAAVLGLVDGGGAGGRQERGQERGGGGGEHGVGAVSGLG